MLVIQEHPLLLLPKLATKIGLNESIFLQQLHYWLKKSSHEIDGHKWVYNSYCSWHEQFPFWSLATIQRIVYRLEKKNLIITGVFNKMKRDRTKWYRINYDALYEISEELKEHFPNEGCLFSTDEMNHRDCPLNSMSQNEDMNSSKRGKVVRNLRKPLPETTRDIPYKQQQLTAVMDKDDEDTNPFAFFEQNGFGTIGGYLAEKIIAWCEDLSAELVVEAMKYAVENGTKHWRYVEGILRHWAEKGYQHLHEVHADKIAFKERRMMNRNISERAYPRKFQLNLTAGEDE